MIQATCGCGWTWARAETAPGTVKTCKGCGKALVIACAEPLPDGAGAGDFDAYFQIVAGPDGVGSRIFLGGVVDVVIGKHEACTIRLTAGQGVSRQHCTLSRVDFGPSRWRIVDNQSTNGVFVNGERVEAAELRDGDVVRIGRYDLTYGHTTGPAADEDDLSNLEELDEDGNVIPTAARAYVSAPPPALAAVPVVPVGDPPACPSCRRELAHGAKVCVRCGVKVPSGRPLLLSQGDDDERREKTGEFIDAISWIMIFNPLPVPLASEAYGRHKPRATWWILGATMFVSVVFFVGAFGHRGWDVPNKQLMLWPPNGAKIHASDLKIDPKALPVLVEYFRTEQRNKFDAVQDELRGKVPDEELDDRTAEAMLTLMARADMGEPGTYQPHQLLTHAFLHSRSGIFSFLGHLVGNMIFLVCFGGRVNALLGNLAMLILYPILAVAAAGACILIDDPTKPMMGASGAVFGLAGMYLVLFPIHRVYCGIWFRLPGCFAVWWVFAMRGFWLLLMYVAFNFLMIATSRQSGVAHWAHIGGFATGVAIALAILGTRLVNCGGGDLLSVTLGRWAWPLIGRPARWHKEAAAA